METDKQKLEKLENLYEMVMDFEKKKPREKSEAYQDWIALSVYYSGYFSVPSYGDEKFKDYFSGALDHKSVYSGCLSDRCGIYGL